MLIKIVIYLILLDLVTSFVLENTIVGLWNRLNCTLEYCFYCCTRVQHL